MFTVEMDFDVTTVTVLDDAGEHEDVKILFHDDGVDIYQIEYFGPHEVYNIVTLSNRMVEELTRAYNSPEGGYVTRPR